MKRVTRTVRGLDTSSEPDPSQSTRPDIPVTPMTLFFGFIGLSLIAQFVGDGYRAVVKALNPVEISQCLKVAIAAPDQAEVMSTSEWASASDRVEHGRTVTIRTAAEDNASNCPVETCDGDDLADYKMNVEEYLNMRLKRIVSLSRFYGQPGIDSVVAFHDTFADKRIENSMVAMAAAGKLKIESSGSSRGDLTAQAFSMLVKHGADSLVPCGSNQDKARTSALRP